MSSSNKRSLNSSSVNSKKSRSIVGSSSSDLYKGKSLFVKMVTQCGYILMNGKVPNAIKTDQTIFLKKFLKVIKQHDDYPEVTEDIIEGFKKYAEDKQRFIRAMLTTESNEEEEGAASHRAVQDSLVRLLLKTKPLQTEVAKFLVIKLEEFKDNCNVQLKSNTDGGREIINVLQLTLSQLRWLDELDESQLISEQLLNVASKLNHQSACAIITALPEIIDDKIHDFIAGKLKDMLLHNVDLTITVLDTLCSLNCSDDTINNVKESMFTSLQSIKTEELPVVVKYLLQTINSSNAERTVASLRQHLTFSPQNSSQGSQKMENEITSIKLTAESILSAIQYHPNVCDAFLKLIKDLPEESFTSSDLVILVLLCSNFNTGPKKVAMSVMKNKLRSYTTIESLLKVAIRECAHVLMPYMSTLSDLSGSLINFNHPLTQHIGSVLYECMFSSFDNFSRQNVIGCLVQHVGSSFSYEVDCALTILRTLAVDSLPLLCPFTLFVKGILDHIERLQHHQIRLLYDVLSHLAFAQCDKRSPTIQNELHILIRKQLSHSSSRYRYIGIIGSVKILGVLGCPENSSDENIKIASTIIKLLEETTRSNNRIRAFYLDELSRLFSQDMNGNLKKEFNKLFCEDISAKLVVKIGSNDLTKNETSAVYKINDELEIAIPIYFSVRGTDSRHELFCPLLRVAAETDITGTSEVQDLTMAPIILHSVSAVKDFKVLAHAEQKSILDSLFLALNWFREQINYFSKKKNHHYYALLRLSQYLKLEQLINTFIPALPSYPPPLALFDINKTEGLQSTSKTSSHSANVTEEGDTANCSNMCDDDTQKEQSLDGKGSRISNKTGKKKADVISNPRHMKSDYFRELDVEILNLLKVQMGQILFESEISPTSDNERLQLFPDQLLFILQDMRAKVIHKMIPHHGEKKISPFSSASRHKGFERLDCVCDLDFGTRMCKFLSPLCNHLEAVSSLFQEDSEGMEDLEIDQRAILVGCCECILEIIHSILSWKALEKGSELMKEVCVVIAKRIAPDTHPDSSLKELLENSFMYLKNYISAVQNISLHASVSLSKLLFVVANFSNDFFTGVKPELHELTKSMLLNDWSTYSSQANTGGRKNDMLTCLLQQSFKYSDNVIESISHYVEEILCKLSSSNHDDLVYPSFQTSNSHIVFVCLLETLVDESSKIPGVRTRDDEYSTMKILLDWNKCIEVFGFLVKLLKEFHNILNIAAALKSGRILIENFLKNGMLVCEKMFNLYQDDIIKLLKAVQLSTRQLQHLTCHSKLSKNVSLSKHVPPLKRNLETLLFRVKGMLALHNCQGAFWLGNLKNRNIQGDEILSQVVHGQGDSDDESQSISQDVDMSYSESY